MRSTAEQSTVFALLLAMPELISCNEKVLTTPVAWNELAGPALYAMLC